jgi:cytochrome P450
MPHYIDTDDIYNGYLIPGQSMVIANSWSVSCVFQVGQCANLYCDNRSMTRDEEVYPDPESFKPERFIQNGTLNKNIRDPRDIVFGFGRRCVLFRFTASSFKTDHAPILIT